MSAERFHLADPAAAMLVVSSQIPDSALSAALLGTERGGHGIRIREDGLVVTVGYLVTEAEQVWLASSDGETSSAYVVAQDHDSGLALLRPTRPIGSAHLVPGSVDQLAVGDPVEVIRSGAEERFRCTLVAKQEFTGRWEYLLDEALFTAPQCAAWAGAALLNRDGELCGVGSLLLEMPLHDQQVISGNMFIPIDLVSQDLDELCTHGQRQRPPRPWLGSLIQEHDEQLVIVGTYPGCPASRAGIEPGDIVVAVNDAPVHHLADLLRSVWKLGAAGVEVPLTVSRSGQVRTCHLQSVDRAAYYHQHTASSWN